MKLLLQILWGWSVLANGAVGIQVGTIQTNNQNIKLMKMNFTSPVWLQSASNVGGAKEYISFVDASGSPQIYQLSAIGDVNIVSTYNGVKTTQLLISPNEETVNIQSDPNTQVILYGKITKLLCDPGPGFFADFTTLDVTKANSLTHLDCARNQLTTLDVSKNTALTYLDCGSNQLTTLDVSANTALTDLRCHSNQLTTLDVSSNTALTALDCSSNQLTTLDVSANTALTYLHCHSNQLTTLDVSANTALTALYCYNNQLTTLDVSSNTALTALDCYTNQLTTLDVSSNTALTALDCSSNQTITAILGIAINADVADSIASAITDASAIDGNVTLRNGDEYNSTISDAATTKGWTVEYV